MRGINWTESSIHANLSAEFHTGLWHGGAHLSDRLLVAFQDKHAYVKPVGRATFKVAPSLKRFCVSVISQGCRDIIFDMTECATLDSTFMGVLAGVAMWPVQDGQKVSVTLTGLGKRTRSMLSTLGLERVLILSETGCLDVDEDDPAVTEIDQDVDQSEALETMRTAHQNLVRVDQDNAARFCDVLTYLDQEIKRLDA